VQNKKELTISGITVDKMRIEENLGRLYNCIFTANETVPENHGKVLLINKLPEEECFRQISI